MNIKELNEAVDKFFEDIDYYYDDFEDEEESKEDMIKNIIGKDVDCLFQLYYYSDGDEYDSWCNFGLSDKQKQFVRKGVYNCLEDVNIDGYKVQAMVYIPLNAKVDLKVDDAETGLYVLKFTAEDKALISLEDETTVEYDCAIIDIEPIY